VCAIGDLRSVSAACLADGPPVSLGSWRLAVGEDREELATVPGGLSASPV
jgi:hypothetical protein